MAGFTTKKSFWCNCFEDFIICSTSYHAKIWRIQRNLYTLERKLKNQYCIAVIFRPRRQHCSERRRDSLKITAWAQIHFWTPLSVNTVCFCIHESKVKLQQAKIKHLENHDRCVLYTGGWGGGGVWLILHSPRICDARVWGITAHGIPSHNLNICSSTIYSEWYIHDLAQHMLPTDDLLQWKPCLFHQDNAKLHSSKQQHGSAVKESRF